MGDILFLVMGIMVLINVPIAISIGLGTAASIAYVGKVPLFLVAQRMFTGMDAFPLLAIPLFMVAGTLMERGGISRRLIDFATSLVGNIYGGLGIISVLACMFFAAISGSAPATVVAIGAIMVPAMVKEGYDKAFAVALMAAGGTIGVIIPPSIPFVTYGITMNVSIGKLFAAGIGPGILMGAALMLVCYCISKKHGYKSKMETKRNPFKAAGNALLGLMMPLIILGGIYGGIFTPTEAAAVACVYSFVVGAFVYRELSVRDIYVCMYSAAIPAAMVMLIIGCAQGMGWVLTTEQVPVKIAQFVAQYTDTQFMLLLIINIILLLVGCVMELNASIIILGPIFMPLILKFGVDPVHFGVIMVVNMTIGLLTPPLGVNLFVANGLCREVPFRNIVEKVIPMLIALIAALMVITYVPGISLFFANLLG
ncbi:MAG: TRAP transporter large permease [Deltaproteobacteria bacterium]|nr:TRAP transporter large permease [Deltaproteobacteria bacterium]